MFNFHLKRPAWVWFATGQSLNINSITLFSGIYITSSLKASPEAHTTDLFHFPQLTMHIRNLKLLLKIDYLIWPVS